MKIHYESEGILLLDTVTSSGANYRIWDPQYPNSYYTITSSSRTYTDNSGNTLQWSGGYITYIYSK